MLRAPKLIDLPKKSPVHSVKAKMVLPLQGEIIRRDDGEWIFRHENGKETSIFRVIPTRILREGDEITATLSGPPGRWRLQGNVAISKEKVKGKERAVWVIALPGGKQPLWKLFTGPFLQEGITVEVTVIRK